jgi:hypothetical protein
VRVLSAVSRRTSPAEAVAEVAAQLGEPSGVVLAFVPTHYDLCAMARALSAWAGPDVVGCTSAGGIDARGYAPDSLVAVVLSGEDLRARTVTIGPLEGLDAALAQAWPQVDRAVAELGREGTFAVLLVDGLSLREEPLADRLSARLGGIPLVGGSAGDDLRFERTAVLAGDRFRSGFATLTLVNTAAPWRRFRVQHHRAGEQFAVVTAADPGRRIVYSLNGRPAALEYAALVGVDVEALTPAVFSAHPLVLRAGGGEWVRSISRQDAHHSLHFFCAAETGDVLRVGRSALAVETLASAIGELEQELGHVGGMLVLDCILRRLECTDLGIDQQVGALLGRYGAVGFSTYGEQYDGVHVNQTMVGVAFGG